MAHPLPINILDNCEGGILYCMAKWASVVTGGFFWTGLLLAFCVVLFMVTQRFGTTRAFGFGSFVGLLGGIWLTIAELIPWWVGSTFILVGIIGLGALVMNEK